jgi:NAD(P)-dependent dehydrogenase (short-subunit alcohol dehydrogenase family)
MTDNTFRLDGRVAIVTGGGRGLGEVFCDAYAGAGAKIVVADLIEENARQVAGRLSSEGHDALAVEVDVRSTKSVTDMVDAALSAYGQIDVLMNNAGVCRNIEGEDMSDDDWDFVIDINLSGVFRCCRAVADHMLERGKGAIVNVGSMSGVISNHPQPQSAYNASKAGVIMLTKSLAGEWAKRGVRVNCISPGYMATDMTLGATKDAELLRVWLETTPMERMGEPKELGPLAVYLSSDASSFVTGSNVLIDGGYTAW